MGRLSDSNNAAEQRQVTQSAMQLKFFLVFLPSLPSSRSIQVREQMVSIDSF
jgi:hypothetical protein